MVIYLKDKNLSVNLNFFFLKSRKISREFSSFN